jgi:hypothetical protein
MTDFKPNPKQELSLISLLTLPARIAMSFNSAKRSAMSTPIVETKDTTTLQESEIEAIAVKHEAFGFGLVDEKGYTTHGFDPDGLQAFVKELLQLQQVALKPLDTEDFCYCNKDISLQIVSGGAASAGLYGEITVRMSDGSYVTYVKKSNDNQNMAL